MTTPITQDNYSLDNSRTQLLQIRDDIMGNANAMETYSGFVAAAEYFEPSELSEIISGLFITSRDGVEEAILEGHFIINVTPRGELNTYYDAQIGIVPYDRTNIPKLNGLSWLIKSLLASGYNVTVHCSMGMERSVLAVAYYLNGELDMSLDEAYAHIISQRPIALDRRDWASL
jgi:hypothetical protein|tara:strand:- start:291 stop:812 length:522 start_codon:yes stop_codon:yes gene_type:complete